MTATIRRTPAVQGVYSHRHWPLEEDGRFVDHAHAIGRREHDHLSKRLGSVVLSFGDRGAAMFPTYLAEPKRALTDRQLLAVLVAELVLFLLVLWLVGLR